MCYIGEGGTTLYLYIDDSRFSTNLIKTLTASGIKQTTSSSTAFSADDFTNNSVKTINFILKDTDPNVVEQGTAEFKLTLRPAFRVKFLNADPKDSTTEDEFSTIQITDSNNNVISKSVGSPYPIIVYEGSTSTNMALGGDVKDPDTIIDSTTKKV